MAGAGVLRLAAKVLAKKLARKPKHVQELRKRVKHVIKGNAWESMIGEQKRLPEGLEFLRGYAKRSPMENLMVKTDKNLTPEAMKKLLAGLPTHVDTIPLRKTIREGRGKIKNLFRGETLNPDQQYISKTGIEQGMKPGNWWTAEPFEAAHYAIRPSKGIMGSDINNPGVIRRMSMNKDIEDMGSMKNRGTGMTHFHPPQDKMDSAKISMFYSVVNRLREMGLKDSQIFKYIGQIMKKKNAAGKRDYMLYNSGGKV